MKRYFVYGSLGCVGYLTVKQFGYVFPALFGPAQAISVMVLVALIVAVIVGAIAIWQEVGKPKSEDFIGLALLTVGAMILLFGVEGLALWLAG